MYDTFNTYGTTVVLSRRIVFSFARQRALVDGVTSQVREDVSREMGQQVATAYL